MNEPKVPQMTKWPFFVADAVAFIGCYLIYNSGSGPLSTGEMIAFIVCGALGMIFLCYPFIQEYRTDARIAEADQLAQVTDFMARLEKVKNGVTVATAHLETAQDYAEKTIESSKEIAERMTDEAKAFAEFMAKANDTEKAHLQLEVDKLKQGEMESIKALMTTLDETFRISQAAARSGNPGVAEQLGKFQAVCRAAASRVGLVPFEADFGDPFNSEKHVLPDPKMEVPEGARIGGTLAPGYTYMRRPLRPAAVLLQGAYEEAVAAATERAAAESEDVEQEAGEVATEEIEIDVDAGVEPTVEAGDFAEEGAADVEDEDEGEDEDLEAEPDFNDLDDENAEEAEDLSDDALAEDPFAGDEDAADAEDYEDEDEVGFDDDEEDDGSDLVPDEEDADFIAQQLTQAEEEASAADEDDEDSESRQRELL